MIPQSIASGTCQQFGYLPGQAPPDKRVVSFVRYSRQMHCCACGYPVASGSRYCGHCGAPQIAAESSDAGRNPRSMGHYAKAIIVLIALIGIAMFFNAVAPEHKQSDTPSLADEQKLHSPEWLADQKRKASGNLTAAEQQEEDERRAEEACASVQRIYGNKPLSDLSMNDLARLNACAKLAR